MFSFAAGVAFFLLPSVGQEEATFRLTSHSPLPPIVQSQTGIDVPLRGLQSLQELQQGELTAIINFAQEKR